MTVIKLKIIKCSGINYWYKDFIERDILINTEEIITTKVNHPDYRELAVVINSSDFPIITLYGGRILLFDTNYDSVIRKMKLEKINSFLL